MTIKKIEAALDDIRQGKMVILVDDEDRENEGDFIMAADKVTDWHINFMAMHGRGMICAPISTTIANKLALDPMVGIPILNSFIIKVVASKSSGLSFLRVRAPIFELGRFSSSQYLRFSFFLGFGMSSLMRSGEKW